MKAVVARAIGRFGVEEVELDPPRRGEVCVRLAACGVCHSDLSVVDGTIPLPMPIVLGHEGAGVVEEVGEGVEGLAPGDHVVLSFIPICGRCHFCARGQPHLCTLGQSGGRMLDGTSRVRSGGEELGVLQFLGAMAERAVVPAVSAVRIDPAIPLDRAALVGCAVMTGVGAAIHTARVTPGSTVAVFGCGGIGLSIVQGARLAGAERVIAVDVAEKKLALAGRLGATDALDASAGDPVERIRALTDGIGVDFAFEAVGRPELMLQAHASARRGGTAVVVGLGRITDSVPLNALLLSGEAKTLKGCFYGDANPPADFPRLLALYRRGRLDLDAMVTATYSIDEAPRAFDDLAKGVNARGVIVFEG
jgi:S-(hydroxymethyl)glutathione dehydrogenase/alcohol dehydrogenase